MAGLLLRRKGWLVNHKRVHGHWREEGTPAPNSKQAEASRAGRWLCAAAPSRTSAPGLVNSFQFDATVDGRQLKFLNVIDEDSRFCLAIRVGRRCKAKDVVAMLKELARLYPAPAFIRSDNGPEFIAHALRRWHNSSGTGMADIEPGSPWKNGFTESYLLRSTSSTSAGSGTNSSISRSSRHQPRPSCCQTNGGGSTTPSGSFRPSRGLRPWRQLNQLPHNNPLSFGLDQ